MHSETQQALIDYLSGFVTPERRDRIETVLSQRTRYITVVLEDIKHTQNASAVLRSCDIFGLQDIHIVEQNYGFRARRMVTAGANKWLTLHRYRPDATAGLTANQRCFDTLRAKGYAIAATTPSKQGILPDAIAINQPLAIVFGSEKKGISDIALQQANCYLHLPMYGFSESFNLSVSVGLCLQPVIHRLRSSSLPWRLSETEKFDLRLDWLRKSAQSAEALERRFWQNYGDSAEAKTHH
ncbi:MAG: RNA methyltransferase [Cyanobacteria bacterium P01_H01_bin.162]